MKFIVIHLAIRHTVPQWNCNFYTCLFLVPTDVPSTKPHNSFAIDASAYVQLYCKEVFNIIIIHIRGSNFLLHPKDKNIFVDGFGLGLRIFVADCDQSDNLFQLISINYSCCFKKFNIL